MQKKIQLYNGFVLLASENESKDQVIGLVSRDGRMKSICSGSKIPDRLIQKLILIEDKRFYNHFGIDLRAIARAFIANVRALKIVQGGSTITQQLARNLFNDYKISMGRKLREIFHAFYLELKYSKREILELYFNSVFWGRNLYGIRSASLYYFGKEIQKLNEFEQNSLITLLKGPNYYLNNHIGFKKRLDLINRKLFLNGLYNKKTYRRSLKKEIKLKENKMHRFKEESIPFITNSIDASNFLIYTTLNKKLQNYLAGQINCSKIPLTIIIVVEGKVKAFSSTHGSNHPFVYRSNVGSTLKPIIYTILRKNGISRDESISNLNENPYHWKIREVNNHHGTKMTLREALYKSNNNTFVNASLLVGMNKVITELAGYIPGQRFLTPSILLGSSTNGISLYELAVIYNKFFSNNEDAIRNEARVILGRALKDRLNISVHDGYLKTGTTNDFKQRFAIFGTRGITVGFLSEGFKDLEEDDYEKDTDYLFVVRHMIQEIIKRIKS